RAEQPCRRCGSTIRAGSARPRRGRPAPLRVLVADPGAPPPRARRARRTHAARRLAAVVRSAPGEAAVQAHPGPARAPTPSREHDVAVDEGDEGADTPHLTARLASP